MGKQRLSARFLFLVGWTAVVSPLAAVAQLGAALERHTTQQIIATRTLAPDSGSIPRYASRITAAPRADEVQKLFARQQVQSTDDRFCAYVNGNGASPLYCPAGYTCTLLGNQYLASAFGCCNKQTCINAPRTCFGQNDPVAAYCSYGGYLDCTSLYTSVLSCTGNKPKCATYILKTNSADPQDTRGVQSWSCAASATQIFVYLTPISNVNAAATYDETTPSPTGSSGSQDDKSSNKSSDNNSNGNGRGLDNGVIIGIVIAVVGVLATVLVGLFPRQLTRCLTCGRRPKKEHTNDEIRRLAWGYLSGGGGGQVHVHLHGVGSEQALPLSQGAAPIGGGGQPLQYDQQYWQGQQHNQQWGYAGYGQQHPPPAYQSQGQQAYAPGYHGEYVSPAQYAAPQSFQMQEQHRPFLELDDTPKK
ncbi:hypothetical protein H072_9540 [Dactylellina haptotyla CBS 200.50]|uniref:Uncharacterized protein n=1 Tax=Dactylellina haptotyla (strain CBS 200.50) TaxID=1284197 RepID=S8A1S1_DACHA|nr:hypothetical protein H072_9540 [Dactylellina haptotyla CBS 200.50]